ncbi:MAG: helix-turn-helix transcriptional regulator [Segatella copri]
MNINRIKVVLAEKNRTNKFLAESLSVDPSQVSRWVTNRQQPNLEKLLKIANALEVEIRELLQPSKCDI